jgi:hypothetical protein
VPQTSQGRDRRAGHGACRAHDPGCTAATGSPCVLTARPCEMHVVGAHAQERAAAGAARGQGCGGADAVLPHTPGAAQRVTGCMSCGPRPPQRAGTTCAQAAAKSAGGGQSKARGALGDGVRQAQFGGVQGLPRPCPAQWRRHTARRPPAGAHGAPGARGSGVCGRCAACSSRPLTLAALAQAGHVGARFAPARHHRHAHPHLGVAADGCVHGKDMASVGTPCTSAR